MLVVAEAVGYRPQADWLEIVGDGLVSFVQSRHITRVVFLNCSSRRSLDPSSNGVTEELEESAWDGRPFKFEQFLADVFILR